MEDANPAQEPVRITAVVEEETDSPPSSTHEHNDTEPLADDNALVEEQMAASQYAREPSHPQDTPLLSEHTTPAIVPGLSSPPDANGLRDVRGPAPAYAEISLNDGDDHHTEMVDHGAHAQGTSRRSGSFRAFFSGLGGSSHSAARTPASPNASSGVFRPGHTRDDSDESLACRQSHFSAHTGRPTRAPSLQLVLVDVLPRSPLAASLALGSLDFRTGKSYIAIAHLAREHLLTTCTHAYAHGDRVSGRRADARTGPPDREPRESWPVRRPVRRERRRVREREPRKPCPRQPTCV
jgi:hypothetical protein